MELLYGKPVAERILAETQERVAKAGVTPGLAVLLIGDDTPSHLYVDLKEKAAKNTGMYFEKILLPADVPSQDIFRHIDALNMRPDIHGIIVQLPLPAGLPTDEIIARITPLKDVDGFHPETTRQYLLGYDTKCPVFPRAIVELLRSSKQVFSGEKGLVLANSELLGKVMSQALRCEGLVAEYILSSETKENIVEKTKTARVLVTACGIPEYITAEMVAEGSTIIDGGIVKKGGQITGDVDRASVETKAAFLSPVPGGVGPVTIACLLRCVTDAALHG